MNTISSSSSYTATSAASKGLSSLASGIDTESMVESMLSGIQSKIDKAQGDKTVLGWKQDMYRDIIKDMNEFHDKYFNILSENCLLSNAFYNAMKAVSSSGAVNVTADSTASTGKTSIEVGQLATATSIKSGSAVSGVLEGQIDADALKKREVVVEVDGVEKTVDLSGIDSAPDKKAEIISQFSKEGINASYDAEGRLILDAGNEETKIQISGKSSAWGLATTGLAAYSSGYKGKITTAEEVDPDKKPSFTVSLDGVKKTITIDPSKINTSNANPYADLETDIKSQLKAAFGNGVKNFSIDNTGKMTFEAGAGREIVLGGDSDTLKDIGFVAGQSNRIARGQTLKEAAFNTKLEGNYFAININGVDLEFSGDETISQMMSKINNSDAGVKISYNNFEDQFVMESTSTGEGYEIQMSQTSGNLLNALFGDGIKTGESVGSGLAGTPGFSSGLASSEIFDPGPPMETKELDLSSNNGEFRINVNGKDYVFTIKKDSEDENDDGKYTPEELVKKINEQLKKQFNGEIELKWQSGGTTQILVTGDQAVKFGGIAAKSSSSKDLASILGFKNGDNNYIDDSDPADTRWESVRLEKLGFNVPSGAGITTVKDLKDKIDAAGKAELTIKDGRLHLSAKAGVTGDIYAGLDSDVKKALASVFGSNGTSGSDPSLTLGQTTTGTAPVTTKGQNAIVKINGVETERSTNIFKTNGIQFELNDTTTSLTKNADGTYTWGTSNAAKVDTSRDTDKMFDTIKGLVADYNKIVEKLNGKVKEDADYKDYPPLTDAQKKEMSESEVKLWNEKAQKGLLRNDSDVSTLLSSMRMAFYNKPAGSSISIWDLGIETTDDYKSGGKLTLNESTLKQMLQSNPDDIRELFFNGTDGIFDQLSTSIKASTNTSFGSRGTLVALAGYGGTASDKSNTIYNRMRDLDEKVKTLKKTYEKQKTRYWNQFNSMEKMIANMNSQSSWLAQQFA